MDEAELPTSYDGEVLPFWRDNGQEKILVSDRGGVALAGMAFPQPSPSTAIVICSGRTESFIKYKELIYDLYQAGYSVYILDHRGQGLSGRELANRQMGYVRDFDDYVADLKKFYSRFVLPMRHRRHVLLGHSMGGCIGSAYLETYPGDFDCAVLASPMHLPAFGPAPEALVEAVLGFLNFVGRGDAYAPGKRGYDDRGEFADNQLTHSGIRWGLMQREYCQTPSAKLGGPSVAWVRAALEAGRAARENATAIGVPVLLLQAGADTIVSPEAQVEFCERLNQTHPGACRLVRIPGAWHELFMEADLYRQPALKLTLEFIRRCTG